MNLKQNEEKYTLYVHTCIETKKVYVGITYKEANERWKDGEGYKTNFELYSDIRKYGWENGFFHQIVRDNLSYEKAKEAEIFFIEMYDSTNELKGYNHNPGGEYGTHRTRIDIGEKIKNLRKTKKVNQTELAEYLGVQRSTISNYEINRRTPSLGDLKRISDYFGVGLDYFGTPVTDLKFEIYSKIIEYFKDETLENNDKIDLFNDILTLYTHIILNKNN